MKMIMRRMKNRQGMKDDLNSQNTEPLLSFPQHCSQQLQVCSFLHQSSELCGKLFRELSMVGFVFFQYSILQQIVSSTLFNFVLCLEGPNYSFSVHMKAFCAYFRVGNIWKYLVHKKNQLFDSDRAIDNGRNSKSRLLDVLINSKIKLELWVLDKDPIASKVLEIWNTAIIQK